MHQASGTTWGGAQPSKEYGCRQRKRSRAEETAPSTLKASKFRRSNASSSAIASSAVTGSANFPVDPSIRAKQTQLFGNRIYPPSTGPPKKGKVMQKATSTTRHQQQTLSESLRMKKKTTVGPTLEEFGSEENKENIRIIKPREESSLPLDDFMETSRNQNVAIVTRDYLKATGTPEKSEDNNNASEQALNTVSVSTTAGTDISDVESNELPTNLNSFIVLSCDKQLLSSRITATSLRYDSAAYGQDWVLHHRTRENSFQPWQMALTGKIEKLRLSVIEAYWDSMKIRGTTPATIFIAINNFGRLLHCWDKQDIEHPSSSRWALTALVAYRLAFKTEERPEVLWGVSNFWHVFPMFNDCAIDRSDQNVNKVEMEALRILEDSMDVPLAPMFLALYIAAGGWPQELVSEYHELGLYLLSLATFASTKDTLLRNVVPSKLAAAALVLAVKIINGDRGSEVGILRHLSHCRSTSNTGCICRYEFFPSRLEIYSSLTMDELQPIIRGLSSLLRSRPSETAVLKNYFPLWGDNDWQ